MTLNTTGSELTARGRPPIRYAQRMRRGGGVSGLGLTCTYPQQPTNMRDGTVKCCGGPAYSDPCSYFNQDAAYLQTQAQATQDAIATSPSFAQFYAKVGKYPQNIQFDVEQCYYNPGATFTDQWGQVVKCPADQVMGPAGPVSALSAEQLGAYLAANVGSPNVPTNAPDGGAAPGTPNSLNVVAPTQTVITPVTPTNALIPPQGTQTPSQQSIANTRNNAIAPGTVNTSTGPVGAANVDALASNAASWLEQNWILVAAGLAAVFILPSVLGGGKH